MTGTGLSPPMNETRGRPCDPRPPAAGTGDCRDADSMFGSLPLTRAPEASRVEHRVRLWRRRERGRGVPSLPHFVLNSERGGGGSCLLLRLSSDCRAPDDDLPGVRA